jgi:hypothetical protein
MRHVDLSHTAQAGPDQNTYSLLCLALLRRHLSACSLCDFFLVQTWPSLERVNQAYSNQILVNKLGRASYVNPHGHVDGALLITRTFRSRRFAYRRQTGNSTLFHSFGFRSELGGLFTNCFPSKHTVTRISAAEDSEDPFLDQGSKLVFVCNVLGPQGNRACLCPIGTWQRSTLNVSLPGVSSRSLWRCRISGVMRSS